MNNSIIDLIGEIFWFGILAAPVLSFLIVRRWASLEVIGKIIAGISITILLAFIFFLIAWGILLRDGLGPG